MKYTKFLLSCLIGGLTLAVSGCKDDDDSPRYQLQLGESGRITLQFDYQKTDTVVRLNVMNRDQAVNSIQLVRFTDAELAAYNSQWNTDYVMMPEDAYTMAATTVNFNRGELQKATDITFYPSVLYTHLISQLDSRHNYCLPLKMVNEATSDQAVYVVSLDCPEMMFTTNTDVQLGLLNATSTDVQVTASLIDNGIEIANGVDCEFELVIPENKEAWTAQYNLLNNTQYTLLPEAYATLGHVTGAAEASACNGIVTINRSPEGQEVLTEGQYVLPVVPRKLSGTDAFVLRYDTIAITLDNPLHVFTTSEKISQEERNTWRIQFCNSDMGVWNSDGIITNILDGRQDTFWASWYAWQNGQENWWNDHGTPSDWCDYGLAFLNNQEQTSVRDMFSESNSKWRLADDYIFIAGNRDNPTFVIDLGKEYYISEVGMCHRSQTQYAQTKTADIYITADPEFKFTSMRDGGVYDNYNNVNENNWVKICTIETERSTAEFWSAADDDLRLAGQTKARFLKFVNVGTPLPEQGGTSEHDRSLQYAGVGEIWIKTLEAVDGTPVDELGE